MDSGFEEKREYGVPGASRRKNFKKEKLSRVWRILGRGEVCTSTI